MMARMINVRGGMSRWGMSSVLYGIYSTIIGGRSPALLYDSVSQCTADQLCRRRSGALTWLQFYWYYYCVHW